MGADRPCVALRAIAATLGAVVYADSANAGRVVAVLAALLATAPVPIVAKLRGVVKPARTLPAPSSIPAPSDLYVPPPTPGIHSGIFHWSSVLSAGLS